MPITQAQVDALRATSAQLAAEVAALVADGVIVPPVNPWATVPNVTINAGQSVSVAGYYTGPAGVFSATGLPAGVTSDAAGLLTAVQSAANATSTAIESVDDGAVVAPSPVVIPPPVILPPAPPVVPPVNIPGSLKLVSKYTMTAAINDPLSIAPKLGKHFAFAYRPSEKAIYVFGGDGTSHSGVGLNSHGVHFGKITLGGPVPVWSHFYPYLGIAGKDVPSGYDCAPFVYDSRRDCFWQVGGYTWGITEEGWVGTPKSGGVWKFVPGTPWGEWTQVTTDYIDASDEEGMQAIYHPRTDSVIGVKGNYIWWYECTTGQHGFNYVLGITDERNIGRYNALGYDEAGDEIFYVSPINGKVLGLKLTDYRNRPTAREIATVPGNIMTYGQFPTIFVPGRRELVCFYGIGLDIKSVNVDTGVVTSSPYPPEIASLPSFVPQAIYDPVGQKIVGISLFDVVTFGWQV